MSQAKTLIQSTVEVRPEWSTLVDLLQLKARLHPDRVVYTFLADGATEESSVTYADLDRDARAIAAWLQTTTSRDDRVLLLYPPGLEYIKAFFGCLYAGVIAVPAYPPRNNRNLLRLQSLIDDARPSIALTTPQILTRVNTWSGESAALQKVRWLIAETIDDEWQKPRVTGNDLAFLQYTSGSTAAPKGVMLTHSNLFHNDRLLQRAFGQNEQSVIVGWLPLYHDMGLIGIVIHSLAVGARCILMSPVAFLQQPFRWLETISQYRATTSGGPNFAYELCARRISSEQRATLDLSSWNVAFNGAEPIRVETLDRFAKTFAPCGFRREAFRPCYGLAEATLLVSARVEEKSAAATFKVVSKKALEQNQIVETDTGETRKLVSCGDALLEDRVIVVDPDSLTRCPAGKVGEIWVNGPSVALGYWNKPRETKETFWAVPADGGGGKFLRTGDLGFVHEGELFLTGRLKDLIVTRGLNHYPQDIELTVEQCHPALRAGCGAAFSVTVLDEERVVVVQELDQREPLDTQSLISSIRERISEEHELAVHAVVLIRAGSIPKTSSGKIQRKACRKLYLENGLKVVTEWREGERVDEPVEERRFHTTEDWLRSQLASLLKIKESEIDVQESILRYGLDSLLATELTHVIETNFGVAVSVNELLENPTIAALASIIENSSASHSASSTADLATEYPLSFGQRSLWFLHRIAPDSAAYNLATALKVFGELDTAALHRAFETLVQRHDALRTTFSQHDGTPVQRVHGHIPLTFEQVDATKWSEPFVNERLVQAANRPFDLSTGPLLRVALLNRSDREHVLLFVVHHIVADFWSLAILMKELGVVYEAERGRTHATLPALTLQYADYVRQETSKLESVRGEQLWKYWSEQLGTQIPSLNLPTDRPRPALQTFNGASHAFNLSAKLTAKLRGLARAEGTTLYTVLLGAFETLLHRYTEQTEFIIGSPTAARDSAALASVVGYFVNPLPLRADLSGNPSFVELLARVRRTVLDAFAHQDFPFALLVERLQPERDPSRSPLFQHMFVMQQSGSTGSGQLAPFALGSSDAQLEFGNMRLESFALDQRVSLFDLRLSMAETRDDLAGSMEYNTDLFDATTIERMLGHFETLLESIVADPRLRVGDYALMPRDEKRKVLVEWNDTAVDYGLAAQTLDQLISAQVNCTPDNIAVSFEDVDVTYAELDQRAGALASELVRRGVGPDVAVAICMERSIELVVALVAVLKAGGAYVPLDPGYPRERLRFMVEDAKPAVILDEEFFRKSLTTDDTDQRRGSKPDLDSSNLAYVIYTSGSTGRPKGAMNTHAGIVNRLRWMQEQYRLTEADCVLQKTPFSFDVSVWEFFWPLITGARLVLAKPGGHQDPNYLAQLIARAKVTTMHFVPSMLQAFLATAELDQCASLRRVICSGEALSYEVQQRFHESLNAELHNLYGPTEASVDVTYWACERDGVRQTVPIGRPIANTQIYILDSNGQPVPAGVAGELMIGGTGLGRGYLNRPDLTADRFQPHPFSTTPGARLYRSGDLARFNADGEIEYLGRLDQQVKVRGFRIELGEIEAALSTHDAVRECVVTANDVTPGDTRLVAYVVSTAEPATSEELRLHLKERLPEYMVPSFFVALEQLPRLPNGKIDRRSLPAPSQPESTREFVAPRNKVETEVANIWSGVLRVERPGVHDNFFELGGHSLLAAQIIARINQSFGIDLPLRGMFEAPTIAGLAKAIARNTATRPKQAIERASDLIHVPLSFAQQRLWFLDQLEPGNTAYHMPILLHIEGELDLDVLERCVAEIVHRHDILRTTITTAGGNPVQVITGKENWYLPVVDLSGLPGDYSFAAAMRDAREEAQRPFDLTRGPLLRAVVWRLKGNNHLLLVSMHHVISDGWSVGVFSTELSALYNAFKDGQPSPLPELPIQYADFAHWQRERLASDAAEQLTYWKRQLAGRLPVLALPSEQSRLAPPAHRVATKSTTLSPALIDALKDLSGRSGATLFITLLTAFQILLHRYTGLDDVVVGTPVAGRTRVELESLIGMFSNTLVLRGDLSGNPTFVELLGRVREITLAAHAHQDVPFEMLVEELQPERDLAHTPLFQVMIVLDTPLSEIDLHELQVRQIELTPAAPKFDLILFLRQRGEELVASWEYSTARFDGESIRRMAESFVTLLQSVTVDPEQRIADLELLTTAERRRLLVEWNDTHANCNQELCLHELFEAQVTRTPEAVALVAGTERITYAELNDRANRVTGELRALGVGPESLVGVLMERSSWLIVSLLGVLKAGGAYVPLDPTYPRERLRLMIEDADLKVILTCSGDSIEVTTTDDTDQSRGSNPDFIPSARNLAYLIYTSGSTGKPKGTAIEHHSAVTFMHWARDFFNESELSGVLASTSVCFDLSVFEIFVPLTVGGKVILAANALELPTLNAANEVTLINTVPSAMTELIRMRGVPASVKVVNLAGEPLHKPLAQRVYEVPNIERLLNLYGPSEDTTYSTWAWIDKNDTQPPTIGRPIANTQAYVLDAQLRSVPIGVIGELYLSGDGLARGYLNKPALTAEKFVPDPFSAVPGARMYRTGDLARYLSDARIEFLGRMDHQVKLRGFRIELGEIETLLGQHPAVQSAVVIARDHGEEKSLAAYFVPTPGQTVTQNDLREFLLERLPKYMVPAFLIELAELPLTPNGKIDRKALPAPEDIDVEREDVVVLPRTHVEAAVASLWSQLLNRHDISIHDDFFALGGHSLLAAQLVSRLREQFHVDLPLRSVFETPNVAALAKLIQNSAAESSPILPIARTESLPVSFAQQRLWLLDQIATSAYNITGGMRLQGELDRSAFTKALNAITGRHEILRTSFTLVDGRPVPVIAGKQPADVSFSDLSLLSADEREAKVRELADAQLRQSFDLTRGPLLRVTLLQLSNDEHVALVTMHHLVADGWSLNIFVKEFAAFYESFRSGASPDLPELRIQYADYAHWQRERLRHEVLENQLDYWRRTLSGSLPVLQLPVDNAGDSESKLQAIKLIQKIPAELSQSLRELSRSRGVTLFMTLLAAFKTLLHRYTNEEDLLVGTAIAGRNRAEVEDLIGIFINMLVLRTNFSGNPTFLDLLGRVREVTLDAYANQEVPFEKLVEELQPDRAATRSPFFQVAFGLQQQPLQSYKLDGLELTPLEFDSDVARYDLTLWIFDGEPELKASWTFSTDLFKRETIERMHARFETLLSSVVKNPEARISALEMLSADEKQQAAMREQENIDKLLSVRRRSIRTVGA